MIKVVLNAYSHYTVFVKNAIYGSISIIAHAVKVVGGKNTKMNNGFNGGIQKNETRLFYY